MSGPLNAITQELSLKAPEDLSDAEWAALGFCNLPAVKAGFSFLQLRVDIREALKGHLPTLIRNLSRCCDPDQSFSSLQRWFEAGGASLTEQWSEPAFLEILCQLFAATPALSEYFIRFPARTAAVIRPVLLKQVVGGAAWQRILRQSLLASDSYTTQLAALRRMRVECMLQIAALDLSLRVPMQDTVRALSDLADACMDSALYIAVERLRPRLGIIPPSASKPAEGKGELLSHSNIPFVVFALGKLGGRELNYSSDIDLVFAYGGEGETIETQRPVDFGTYFAALGGEFATALDKMTEDGRVYRVDLRLRPHGSVGALAHTIEQMQNYFQSEGRTWERQAWLKARAAAGDLSLGNGLLNNLTTFIFRRYLTLDSIGDMQNLKRQIELSVAKRGESEDEVKLGRGGIRDIEFTVQFMQLLHGSEHPNVRRGNSLHALYELRRERLLSDSDSEALAGAYIFLRNVEHRLQLHGDLQVHLLPTDPLVRRRIARSLGYIDTAAATAQDNFEADRQKHTSRTRAIFMRLFANLFRESRGPDGELSDLLLAPEPDMPKIAALLPHFGFAATESSAHELVGMSRENLLLTAPSQTRKFFASIAPRLLRELSATGEPDDALRRFSRIVGSLGGKSVFYQMLNEHAWMLNMTVNLAAWSEYLTDILVANPGLFDELVDALRTGQSKTAEIMTRELSLIAQAGDIADTLRAYRAGELLRIGVRDLIHDASLEQTQSELSDLAEAVLRIQLKQSAKQHSERRGEVKTDDGKPVGFAILALGKFGGREMNYGSDLDVIYFYGGEGQTADGLPAVSYFGELAQDLTRAMAMPTSLGLLYELDARLRPNGTKGPLALSLDYFKQYWKQGQLADWERLALTRARVVAGDEGVGERALHLIRSAVYSPLKDTKTLATEVKSMRHRLEESAEKDDLKRGRGGIMDIEFIVQYLQLIHGPAFPPLRQANTEQSLKALMKFKKLSAADGGALLIAYAFLRQLENRVRIVHGLSAHNLPSKPDALRKLALRAGFNDDGEIKAESALMEQYVAATQRVREIMERVIA
jgi:glutamate-ammonia-ligase adenylyltransferase